MMTLSFLVSWLWLLGSACVATATVCMHTHVLLVLADHDVICGSTLRTSQLEEIVSCLGGSRVFARKRVSK